MRKRIIKFWKDYRFRFVPWIIYNLNKKKGLETLESNSAKGKIKANNLEKQGNQSLYSNDFQKISPSAESDTGSSTVPYSNPLIVHHVRKDEDKLISDDELVDILQTLFEKFLNSEEAIGRKVGEEEICQRNKEIMRSILGFSVEKRKSLVNENAGTGVFLASGHAVPGSLIALYPGTIYMPSEPLFFPSIGNPFIFRCSDGIHIDGNDKWISKSIYKSCSARDKFRVDLPCCDDSWLSSYPKNPLNVGQYVNNRSKSASNNVVYQEASVIVGGNLIKDNNTKEFPIYLYKYLPNVWANPGNNVCPLRLVPLVAVKEIKEGDEILSSYFTVLHSK